MAGTTQGKYIAKLIPCRALADVIYIYPLKADKKTFDENKEELGFASKPKVAKHIKTAEELEKDRL